MQELLILEARVPNLCLCALLILMQHELALDPTWMVAAVED